MRGDWAKRRRQRRRNGTRQNNKRAVKSNDNLEIPDREGGGGTEAFLRAESRRYKSGTDQMTALEFQTGGRQSESPDLPSGREQTI